jgi:hypothetical protein
MIFRLPLQPVLSKCYASDLNWPNKLETYCRKVEVIGDKIYSSGISFDLAPQTHFTPSNFGFEIENPGDVLSQIIR